MGETILSAPIVEKGKKHRDIYLPQGHWKDGNNGSIYQGKRWLKNYPAAIDVLPYFINQFDTSAVYIHIEEKERDSMIRQIYFKRSKVSVSIQKWKSNGKYYMKIFNGNYKIIIKFEHKVNLLFHLIGNKFLQIISLNSNESSSLEVREVPNGFELSGTNNLDRISVTIDIDIEDFSVLNIQRKMSNKGVATDCLGLGKREYYCL